MTNTLKVVRRGMLQQEPELGRFDNIKTLTTTTVVVASLATGTVTSGKYAEKWMLRAEAALVGGVPVDRIRMCSAFASTTGTLTHAGTNYADTTATNEIVEIHEYEPYLLENSVQQALATTRYVDTSVMQGRADGRYTFGNLPWVTRPSEIVKIGLRHSPVLTANRKFDQWGTMDTSGVLYPDFWTIAGTGATIARSSTSRSGAYSLSLTRASNDVTADQTVQAVTSGYSSSSLQGQTFTGVLVCRSTNAASVRVRVTSEKADGTVISTTNSSYHTGGGAWEELTAQHTVDSAADVIRVSARVEVDETALLDDCYGMNGEIGDGVRRDAFETDWLEGRWEQNPTAWIGPQTWSEQIVVKSRRPFPEFDATRLAAGTADSDVTDCELTLLTTRALAIFYEQVDAEKAAQFARKADDLGASYLADVDPGQPGAKTFSGFAYGTIATVR